MTLRSRCAALFTTPAQATQRLISHTTGARQHVGVFKYVRVGSRLLWPSTCTHASPLALQVPNFLGGGGVIRDDNVSAEVRAQTMPCLIPVAVPDMGSYKLANNHASVTVCMPLLCEAPWSYHNRGILPTEHCFLLLRSKPQRTTLPPQRPALAMPSTRQSRPWALSRH